MDIRKILTLLIIISVISGKLHGQLVAPAAADSFAAAYNTPSGTDRVFVFNRTVYQEEITAAITAVSVDRTTGWTFEWFVFNRQSATYEPVLPAGSGWMSTLDTITVSSGYQVIMTKGIYSYVYRVWVLINDFQLQITNKNEEDKLQFGYFNCTSLDLRADTTLTPLFYYNPETQAQITVFNNFTIRWTTDNPEASNPSSRLVTRVNNPPSSDTWYFLRVTDRFGLQRYDSVFYESIQSEAMLTATYINLSDTSVYPGTGYGNFYNDGIRSAPGKYLFDFSASGNAVTYRLEFGDGEFFEAGPDTLEIIHEYKVPGNYKAVLTTKSDKPYECPDSVMVEAELDFAGFSLPNVFSPNDDGDNDLMIFYDNNNVFRSEDVSVTIIDIAIFDRAGLKVHEFSGNVRDWAGWDGKVMKSNRLSPEGVYFYVISLLVAYEDENNPIGKKILKGFFHLYRE